jgi:hypothetical protein
VKANIMSVGGASNHPLDHPIRTALTTRQQAVAEGGALIDIHPVATNLLFSSRSGQAGPVVAASAASDVALSESLSKPRSDRPILTLNSRGETDVTRVDQDEG